MQEELTRIADSVQALSNLTTKIDERLTSILDRLGDQDRRFGSMASDISDLKNRMRVVEARDKDDRLRTDVASNGESLRRIESRLAMIDFEEEANKKKWTGMLDFALKLVLGILTAWILLRFGLS